MTILVYSIFQKKSKHLLIVEPSQQIFLEYKLIIQQCVDIFVLDLLLKGKSLADFTNLFSPNNFRKNDHMILNYFKNRY